MSTRLRASVAVFACLFASIALAAPYKPASDDDVLLQIDASQREARMNLRDAANRADPRTAADIAGKFVALGRAQHDERYFGYASAILQQWQNVPAAPARIVILRADVAQYQHHFGAAEDILGALLAREQTHPEAWLMRAAIRMTQGKPQLARQDCQKLFALRESFAATVCLAQAASLNGQLVSSYRLLSNLLERSKQPEGTNPQYEWALAVTAELAERLQNFSDSERLLREALILAPNDFASRLQLCDLLLQTRRPAEALLLLNELSPSEPILLRRALATQQIGDAKEATDALTAWREATERSARLGVTLHLRELARGQLELLNQPQLALQTALKNWQVQREPVDALLLAQASRAAHDATGLKTVRDWQLEAHFEDARLKL